MSTTTTTAANHDDDDMSSSDDDVMSSGGGGKRRRLPPSTFANDPEVRKMVSEFGANNEHSDYSDAENGRKRSRRDDDDEDCYSESASSSDNDDDPPPPAAQQPPPPDSSDDEEMMERRRQQLLPVEDGLYDGNKLDDLDLRYQQLCRRFMQSRRSPTRLLLDECDFDTTLSHEEAIEGADLGRKGYATFEQVTQRIKALMDELFQVEEALHNRNVNLKRPNDVFFNNNRVFDGVIEQSFVQMRHLVDLMWQNVRIMTQTRRMVAGIDVPISTDDLIRNYSVRRAKKNLNLRTITYFLEQASLRRLRKQRPQSGKDDIHLYEPLIIDGYTTVSFKRTGTLADWVASWTRADVFPDLFAAFCSQPGTLTTAIKYLETTEDSRFPFYEVSEFVHGFENCYVDTKLCKAYFYEDNPQDTARLVARHHHHGVKLEKSWFSVGRRSRDCVTDLDAKTWTFEKNHLDGTKQTLVYPFPAAAVANGRIPPPPPLHLQMPAMQQLLDFQEYTPEMQVWFYCMLGRTLLPVGLRDKFDCIVLMSGQTQSGKSTVMEAFGESLLPDKERIAILSSNKEDKFGLQTSYNKDVLICDEMERKPSWNLGEIKSMATGGWMSIPVKFGDPVFMRWRAPVIISSNYKVPEWGGGGNDVYALVRRFAPFPFPHTVARPDPNMPTQLQGPERGLIFVTCMLCYDWIVTYVGNSAFNKIAPPPLLEALKFMLCELHPLVNFLNSCPKLRFAPPDATEEERQNIYVPLDTLKIAYEDWLKYAGIKTDNKWVPEYYRPPLVDRACSITAEMENRVYPRQQLGLDAGDYAEPTFRLFVCGLDIV